MTENHRPTGALFLPEFREILKRLRGSVPELEALDERLADQATEENGTDEEEPADKT